MLTRRCTGLEFRYAPLSPVSLVDGRGSVGLVGAAPLSVEFCGLPQPALSRDTRRRLAKRERMVRSPLWVCQRGRLPDLTKYYSNLKNCQEKASLEENVLSPLLKISKNKVEEGQTLHP
jgi:hypothetical protein